MLTLGNAPLLLAVPLALLLVAGLAGWSARSLSRTRRVLSALVRSLAVLLLIVSLAQPSNRGLAEQRRMTVFLVDVSESRPRRAEEGVLEGLRRLWGREVSAGNRCALVAFAGRAEVLVPPSPGPLPEVLEKLAPRGALERLAGEAERGGPEASPALAERISLLQRWCDQMQVVSTDPACGLAAAQALFEEGSANHIVLVTDGRVPLVPARDIRLPPGTLGVRLADAGFRDVAVVSVEAPVAVRAGEPFDARVVLEATHPGRVSLSLSVDDEAAIEARKEAAVPAGRSTLVLENVQQKRSLDPGLRRLAVRLEAAGDEESRNNAGLAVVTVTGKPRVLIVEGAPAEGEALARLLQVQEIDLVREPAARFAGRSAPLEEFVAVVLAGVPREHLPAAAVRSLSAYLTGSGGGLWVVGSRSLQGAGGYAGSEIEKLLPVTFTEEAPEAGKGSDPPGPPRPEPQAPLPRRVLAPTLAMLFVVDKSGSMAGNSIALVKEACIASARALTPRDTVGVLGFDVKPRWVLEFTDADRQDHIEERILRLFADGGTHIHPALEEALRAFRTDPRARRAAVKHAILLSDGDTLPADFETVVRRMADEGITVTTVCVGSAPKFDAPLMAQIAEWGRGRFLFTNSFKKVPQIFVQEVRQTLGSVPRTNDALAPSPPTPPPPPPPTETPSSGAGTSPLPVVLREPHEILQGLDVKALPPLRGRLAAAARPKVEAPLGTPDGQPVLALWRVGLGKSAVWTSDLAGPWSADWQGWAGSGKLFAQLLRYASSAASDAELASRVRWSAEGGRTVLRIDPGPADESLTALDARTGRPIPMGREPDGGFRIAVEAEKPGEMQTIGLERKDGKKLSLRAFRSYESEFNPPEPAHDLFAGALEPLAWEALEARLSGPATRGERRTDLTLWAIVAVLLLLPLDVALRRYSA